MINRRTFTKAALLLAIAPSAVLAQAKRLPRIGYLGNGTPSSSTTSPEAFLQGLRSLGWVDGESMVVDYRWAEGQPERIPTLLGELIAARADVLFVSGYPAARAAQLTAGDRPVVFVLLTDPVSMGLVKSLAHPGGSMTGLGSHFEDLITKQLELLKEAVPNLARVALLDYSGNPSAVRIAVESAARSLGLTSSTLVVAGPSEFENAFKSARKARAGAIHVLPSAYFNAQRSRLIELAAKYRLPACYEFGLYVRDGGLMSYGPNIDEMFGHAATYIDRILRGAKPGDLPIERPARFELVVNLRTAAALGLAIPPSLLQRADQVIE